MMTGLYGSDFYKDIYTADEFIKLRPDTVRIYPTVIMQDTNLQIFITVKSLFLTHLSNRLNFAQSSF